MALTICAKCKREWQANSGVEPCPWCRASSAESSLAAMRQRAEEAESKAAFLLDRVQGVRSIKDRVEDARDAAIARAERAEACLRDFVSILSIPHPVEPETYKELLTTAFGHAKELLGMVPDPGASPPADASTMGGERDRQIADVLRHVCKYLCQWKDACETGCIVSAALADKEQKS